jgi:hypothetical protein
MADTAPKHIEPVLVPIHSAATTTAKLFPCPHCGLQLTTSGSRARHVKRKHIVAHLQSEISTSTTSVPLVSHTNTKRKRSDVSPTGSVPKQVRLNAMSSSVLVSSASASVQSTTQARSSKDVVDENTAANDCRDIDGESQTMMSMMDIEEMNESDPETTNEDDFDAFSGSDTETDLTRTEVNVRLEPLLKASDKSTSMLLSEDVIAASAVATVCQQFLDWLQEPSCTGKCTRMKIFSFHCFYRLMCRFVLRLIATCRD